MSDNTVDSSVNELASAKEGDVTVEDAREAIVRSIKAGESNTQLTLIEGVIQASGVDTARVFMAALDALLAEGVIHSSRGRNGGLKMGPKPEMTARKQAAALIASFRKVG